MTLTGRVEALEQQVAFLMQEMLRAINTDSLSLYSKAWSQQFDTVQYRIDETVSDLNALQVLYANLVVGESGVSTGFSGIQNSFETISKNLNQYPYSLNYSTGNILQSVYYTINTGSYILKQLQYNNSGLLIRISLTGSPIPQVALNKYLLYSGTNLTGVYYS